MTMSSLASGDEAVDDRADATVGRRLRLAKVVPDLDLK
jgi:hypothetical protein